MTLLANFASEVHWCIQDLDSYPRLRWLTGGL
jgi:hypothetical protein